MSFNKIINNDYKFNLENFICWYDEDSTKIFGNHTCCLDKPNICMDIRTGESSVYHDYGMTIKTKPTQDPNVCECDVALRIGDSRNPNYVDEFSFRSDNPIDVEQFVFNFFGLVYHSLGKKTPLLKKKKDEYIQTGDLLLANLEKIKSHQTPEDLKNLLGEKDYNNFIKRLSYEYGELVHYHPISDLMMGGVED